MNALLIGLFMNVENTGILTSLLMTTALFLPLPTVSFAATHPDGTPSKISIEIQLARRDDYTLIEIEQMALKKANEALRIVQSLDLDAKKTS